MNANVVLGIATIQADTYTKTEQADVGLIKVQLNAKGIEVDDQTIQAALKARLNSTQSIELFRLIHRKALDRVSFLFHSKEVFGLLPSALEAAQKAKLSPAQIMTLFSGIAEKAPKEDRGAAGLADAFKAITPALRAAQGARLAPHQIIEMFGRIVEARSEELVYILMSLPPALRVAQTTRLPSAQIVELFSRIAESTFPGAKFRALPQMLKAKIPPDEIIDIFYPVADKTDSCIKGMRNCCNEIFDITLPSALKIAQKEGNISSNRIRRIIENIGVGDGVHCQQTGRKPISEYK
jgi:hypothetical protein